MMVTLVALRFFVKTVCGTCTCQNKEPSCNVTMTCLYIYESQKKFIIYIYIYHIYLVGFDFPMPSFPVKHEVATTASQDGATVNGHWMVMMILQKLKFLGSARVFVTSPDFDPTIWLRLSWGSRHCRLTIGRTVWEMWVSVTKFNLLTLTRLRHQCNIPNWSLYNLSISRLSRLFPQEVCFLFDKSGLSSVLCQYFLQETTFAQIQPGTREISRCFTSSYCGGEDGSFWAGRGIVLRDAVLYV